jgi:large subunit ribosomal protein L6
MPIAVPSGAKVEIQDRTFVVEGPRGRIEQKLMDGVTVEMQEGEIHVKRVGDSGPERAFHGLTRALLANAVAGVTEGFKKELQIVGVGYRAEVKGREVHFALGYSHPVIYPIPEGIEIEIDRQNKVSVAGPDRQQVGQVAAELRALRPPDPYKGKGIRYVDERLRLKVGKAGAS